MSVEAVIKHWLLSRIQRGELYVKSSDIETSLVHYGKEYWDVLHTPSTYSRAWRLFRSDKAYKDIDISKILEHPTKSRQMTWRIETGT
tara:strand:- start:668 stop:931 length:264 start_codon:yes stop_codon:yes gene_type:complete